MSLDLGTRARRPGARRSWRGPILLVLLLLASMAGGCIGGGTEDLVGTSIPEDPTPHNGTGTPSEATDPRADTNGTDAAKERAGESLGQPLARALYKSKVLEGGHAWDPHLSDGGALEVHGREEIVPKGTHHLIVYLNQTKTAGLVGDAGFGQGHFIAGLSYGQGNITWLPYEGDEARYSLPVAAHEHDTGERRWHLWIDYERSGNPQEATVHIQPEAHVELWADVEPLPPASEKGQDPWEVYRENMLRGYDRAPPVIQAPGAPSVRPVVAVIDTGINPTHELFERPEATGPNGYGALAYDHVEGEVPHLLPPGRLGPLAPSAVEPHTLYRLDGTNLLFYSLLDEVDAMDHQGHGTATAGTVLKQAPGAVIVAVQTDGLHLVDAVAWAAAQPWIDIINLSWGCLFNCIGQYPLAGTPADGLGQAEMADATREAWRSGKLVVASAGNDPTPALTDSVDSPPWVIAVGGAHQSDRTTEGMASKAPDVVANYTVHAPVHDADQGEQMINGTSFSAPTVSGSLAHALHLLREHTGHVGGIQGDALARAGSHAWTNADLREAMNRTAIYWETPSTDEPDRVVVGSTHVPVSPVTPWLQMGWGYVDASLAQAITDGLLQADPPSKQAGAVAYMEGRGAARQALWS